MNICSLIRKHCAPFSDTVRVHNMFTIDHNKSLVNFTGSNVCRLQKPNHASHLTVSGSWYRRVHCLNLSHSQHGKVCSTNCTRQLSTLYWTHHMTHQLKLNNCAGYMRKRSLLSRCHTYYGFPQRDNSIAVDCLEWKHMEVRKTLSKNQCFIVIEVSVTGRFQYLQNDAKMKTVSPKPFMLKWMKSHWALQVYLSLCIEGLSIQC